ncbi:hypothetical protein RRG08_012811 [Elysia crispata]|uniref:Uncharacterized protein n=1 Tax=Elysia crispata TaxID=231223 RepID=A0AAE0XYP1_9GAST|nr:hypothetical protein RRG08_012811 [Elysia crispata]
MSSGLMPRAVSTRYIATSPKPDPSPPHTLVQVYVTHVLRFDAQDCVNKIYCDQPQTRPRPTPHVGPGLCQQDILRPAPNPTRARPTPWSRSKSPMSSGLMPRAVSTRYIATSPKPAPGPPHTLVQVCHPCPHVLMRRADMI